MSSYPVAPNWSMIAFHRADHPVLPILGRRSIFTEWPPGATCESCGARPPLGYVGPARTNLVYFPSPRLRLVCEDCARRLLGLGPQALTGHRCTQGCSDRSHVHLVRVQGEAPSPQCPAVQSEVKRLEARGWRILEQGPPPKRISPQPGLWALWIEPVTPLPWEAERRDDLWLR
jgi:hypothetical protein